jgi:6-phosphofructo-2-kinase/fructose-2,6-biphosphatase
MNLMQTSHEFFMQFFMNLMQIYEPVTEGCYIKMIDMVSDQGGQMQVNNISGYLPGRIVFFLVHFPSICRFHCMVQQKTD